MSRIRTNINRLLGGSLTIALLGWICLAGFAQASWDVSYGSELAGSSELIADGGTTGSTVGSDDGSGLRMLRSINKWELTDILLVSTIDGSLHARDRKTGSELWSIPGDGPLVKVSTSESMLFDEDKDITWIVEPLGDGILYYFLPSTGLQRLSVSIKTLVLKSPFAIEGDDKIYTGSRQTILYSINSRTGEILKVYGSNGKQNGGLGRAVCRPKNNGLEYENNKNNNDDPLFFDDEKDYYSSSSSSPLLDEDNDGGIFMIGRTDYHLEIHGKNETIWNVTYSMWGPNNMDGDLVAQHVSSPDDLYITPLHNCSMLALSTNGRSKPARWVRNVPSVVINIFDILRSSNHGGSEPLVLLPQPQFPFSGDGEKYNGYEQVADDEEEIETVGTYVERTNDGGWFALSGKRFPYLVNSAPTAEWCLEDHQNDYPNKKYSQESLIGVHPVQGPLIQHDHRKVSSIAPQLIERPLIEGSSTIGDGSLAERNRNRNEVAKYYPNQGIWEQKERRPPHHHLDRPPPPPMHLPTRYPSTWWNFITRLVENVLSVLIIVVIIVVGARLGWLPQIVELLESAVLLVTRKNGPSLDSINEKVSIIEKTPLPISLEKKIESSGVGNGIMEEKSGDIIDVSIGESVGSNADVVEEVSVAPNSADTLVNAEREFQSGNEPFVNDEETENENEQTTLPSKSITIVEPQSPSKSNQKSTETNTETAKKRKRGSRGGRKNAVREAAREAARKRDQEIQESNYSDGQQPSDSQPPEDSQPIPPQAPPTPGLILPNSSTTTEASGLQASPLTVSKDIIGYGSQGTVVYRGYFENREVAVKRMLLNFYDIASQEVTLLQESDDHPNVIRYYCKYQSDQFLYIALELCPGTLEDVIEKPYKFEELVDRMNPIQVLHQIASGLNHLHSLKIVHRDIKPQNILVAPPKWVHKKDTNGKQPYGPVRMLISDFGLCKKLEGDQSSFRATTAQPAGTSGWTAPEISMGSRYPSNISTSSSSDLIANISNQRRLTRAVDIFSMGCVFYYILSRGQHPFGINSKRESNIEENNYSLDEFKNPDEQNNVEANDLISRMISFNPNDRPDAGSVLLHPLFWSSQKRLDFLLRISDRFEADTREEYSELLSILEEDAPDVVGDDWHSRLDKAFVENLGKYRKYHGDRIIDLLRAMRNKSHHFNDLPPSLQASMGPLPEGFLLYFTRRFPYLLMTIYYFARKHLSEELAFRSFFHNDKDEMK